jgi:hypothetical protein
MECRSFFAWQSGAALRDFGKPSRFQGLVERLDRTDDARCHLEELPARRGIDPTRPHRLTEYYGGSNNTVTVLLRTYYGAP